MVFCSLCKENKESKNSWIINERGASSTINKFKICDDCASFLMRGLVRQVMGIRDEQPTPNPLPLSHTGVIDEMILHQDNSMEMTIALDISKARRLVDKEKEINP